MEDGGWKMEEGRRARLYGAIKRLQAAGWITESAAARRSGEQDARRTCYYRLTPAGRTAAADAARQMADLVCVAADHGLVKLKPAN